MKSGDSEDLGDDGMCDTERLNYKISLILHSVFNNCGFQKKEYEAHCQSKLASF